MQLQEINQTTKEGQYLMMAIAALTVSPEISLNSKICNGKSMTPDDVLAELDTTVKKVFNERSN